MIIELPKYKTIDEMVEKIAFMYRSNNRNIKPPFPVPAQQIVFENIVSYDLQRVKEILNSSTNVTSKYDIYLIQEINRSINDIAGFQDKYIELIKDVLELYKNRKD